MKVLWFSNSPALADEFLSGNFKLKATGGWMYALNKALQCNVSLSVIFHFPYKIEPFNYQKTTYYPVYTGNIIIENLKKRFLSKVYDDDFLQEYLKIIKQVNPDIIHIHGTENPFLCILGTTKVPVVISIQGNLTVYHHKYLSGFNGLHIRRKSEDFNIRTLLLGRNSFLKGFINLKRMSVIEQKYMKHAKHIIGRTDWDRRITRILAPESKYLVGNEMLRDGFYENQWNNKFIAGKIIIFTTNGNNYYKGFETLCFALFLLNNLEFDVEWRVAGISENSLINNITRRELGVKYPKKGLVLVGSLDENDLIKNLLESHIYVMPSHIENSPNNLCEAMILGIPCIATFAGGTGSLLKDGEEGILIQDGDPWALAGAIAEMKTDFVKAIEFGKKARGKALALHNKETVVAQYLQTYRQIIEAEK